ncbi:MAG TPA: hypothetical protein VML53_00345 [Thermoplasmata archaeon]|nr:hypothetical protein [Thermoplasmata archaeon]
MSVSPSVPSDAPIAATPAQMPGLMGAKPTRPIPWRFLSLLGRGGGLVLLFVGTLIEVIGGSFPADCFTSHCSGSTSAGIQYAILAARLLWAIGAFGLAAGAGIELQFIEQGPESNGPEENARFLARRRADLLVLLVGVGILLALLITQPTAVAPAL